MGDVLQTYRVASSFKKEFPKSRLYLIARKKFACPLKFLLDKCFEKIFFWDADDMTKNFFEGDGVLGNIAELLEDINKNNFNRVINLSWSQSSEYLCSLINAQERIGLSRNDSNQTIVSDGWSQLIYSMVMGGAFCPYNIIDIYKKIAGIENMDMMPEFSKSIEQKNIVVHPFASNPKKHWKHTKWIEVVYKILKNNTDHNVIIVGSEDERDRIDLLIESPVLDRLRDRIEVKADNMGVEAVLEILSCSDIFVGHDSFVSHLAALTDIPIINLAMGTVKIHETAPYSPNAYVVSPKTSCFPCFPEDKCEFYECHVDVPYQIVAGIVDLVLKNGIVEPAILKKNMTTFLTSSVDIFKTKIKESGFLQLEKITDSDVSLKEIFMNFYRVSYMCFFEMPEEKIKIPRLNRKTMNELQESMDGLEYLYELYGHGKIYSKNIIEEIGTGNPSVEKIQLYSENIDEIDNLQNMLGRRYPMLKPMVDFFVVNRKNAKGRNAVEVSEDAFYAYHGSMLFTSMIYELCEKTLQGYDNFNIEKSVNL